jgi:hypothetical protein
LPDLIIFRHHLAPGIERFPAAVVNRSSRTVHQLVSALDVIQEYFRRRRSQRRVKFGHVFAPKRRSPKRGFERKTGVLLSAISKGYIMLIGYARVSTGDQNLDLQKNALIRAECELVFEDTASGKNARRPGLKRALRRCDRVMCWWSGNWIGWRSVRDLITLVSELQARGEFPESD